ncbi:MAG: VOC family protein [Ignavibacteriae bacterium]|nr:VOC family protein [Ignavibacteriota bacterium]
MNAEVGHIELFVKDTLASKEFYSDILGFKEIETQAGVFVWMHKGKLKILLRPSQSQFPSKDYQSTNIGFVLYTDNLENAVKELESKGLQFRGTDGSEKCLTFTDLDGNWFQLVNPDDH